MGILSDFIGMILQYAFYFRRTTRMITPRIVNTSYRHFRNCLAADKKHTKRKNKRSPHSFALVILRGVSLGCKGISLYNFPRSPNFSLTIQHVFIHPMGPLLPFIIFPVRLVLFFSNPYGLKVGIPLGIIDSFCDIKI